MIRKRFDRNFDKSGKFCNLLGNKNFYHVLLSIIISMFVEVRPELGGVASGSFFYIKNVNMEVKNEKSTT